MAAGVAFSPPDERGSLSLQAIAVSSAVQRIVTLLVRIFASFKEKRENYFSLFHKGCICARDYCKGRAKTKEPLEIDSQAAVNIILYDFCFCIFILERISYAPIFWDNAHMLAPYEGECEGALWATL